jgi:hypothetical protein
MLPEREASIGDWNGIKACLATIHEEKSFVSTKAYWRYNTGPAWFRNDTLMPYIVVELNSAFNLNPESGWNVEFRIDES